MVLHKWSVMPRRTAMERHLKIPVPANQAPHPELREPFLLRPFIRSQYVESMQFLENRGMFKEEVDIERSRFPNFMKCLTIGTNGSMDEREFETLVPPVVALYSDRNQAHRSRITELAKVGKIAQHKPWENKTVREKSDEDLVNMLAFPYCVPRKMALRNPIVDPLNSRLVKRILPEENEDSGASN